MPMFAYYHLDGSPCDLDLMGERLHANEWCAPSRMGGVPSFDPGLPVSAQPHHTSLCDDTCKLECPACSGTGAADDENNEPCAECDGSGSALKTEAMGRTHCPPGAPLPYAFCETHRSWATLTPLRVGHPLQ